MRRLAVGAQPGLIRIDPPLSKAGDFVELRIGFSPSIISAGSLALPSTRLFIAVIGERSMKRRAPR